MHLVPQPRSLRITGEAFPLPVRLELRGPFPAMLPGEITALAGLPCGTGAGAWPVTFREVPFDEAEAHRLRLGAEGATIEAGSAAGLFLASRTLLQILTFAALRPEGKRELSALEIDDEPAFAWRGVMLDSARHLQSVDFLKKFIDLMAFHKLNRLQWHLTDDQGWRLEIAKHPRLTEVGGFRKQTLKGHMSTKPHAFDATPYGGFYSRAQVKDLVAYAAARHVTIVPEIDIPGHSQAAIAAYPELGVLGGEVETCTLWGINHFLLKPDEKTLAFYRDVFDEVIDLFPSEFVHVGGDEAHKDQWRASKEVQAMLREKGLPDEEALQAWFLGEIEKHLHARGRKMIGWDEILEGPISPSTAVMSWRTPVGGIMGAKSGHKVVMSSQTHNYFDYYQHDPAREGLAIGGLTPCAKTYSYDVIPPELSAEEAKNILGLQGQLWTEYIPTEQRLEEMAFPRLCALAENAWLPKDGKDWYRFKAAWPHHRRRLDLFGVEYFSGPLE